MTAVIEPSVRSSPVHVTYLPDRHCFAVWQFPQDSDSLQEAVDVDIVMPSLENVLTTVVARALVLDAADTEALEGAATDGGLRSASARAWIAIARHQDGVERRGEIPLELVSALPVAGHAVPDTSGRRVATAAATVEVFAQTSAVAAELADTAVDFTARPYQVRGIAWMRGLTTGGILSDEMGLGKTLQAVAHMAALARSGRGPFLVVCPTSLISNWLREVDRFASGTLTGVSYRGPNRTLPSDLPRDSVVVTGYATLRTDLDHLAPLSWEVVVYDEAHVLKNARTQLARAARRLTARTRIALTGTPVENRMDELWSLLDLTNPSLLGSKSRFKQRISQPIERHGSADALALLTSAIEPVVLRRTKSQVASDLPPKHHIDLVCSATADQARLYNEALEQAFDGGLGGGASRGTRILALLTRLKLICNHPRLVDHSTGDVAGKSGKLDRLTDIVVELGESGSRALIFTQYRETGDMLSEHLSSLTGRPVPFFHGGLSAQARDAMVEGFKKSADSPAMVLSLRAAGFGLNLTEADTVIHFDRWWNPAVEAQASDRAHRIGQSSPVSVITLTTEGTVEEYIAELHERKKAISTLTESSAENALAALDDMNLRSVLTLRQMSR